MHLAYSQYALLPLLTLATALVLVQRAWRYRADVLGRTFLVLMLALSWWSVSAAMEHVSLDLSAKVFWVKASYFGVTAVPVGWFVLALTYGKKMDWLTGRRLALLLVVPVVTLLIVWTNDLHHLMWKSFSLDASFSPPVDVVTHGAWFWFHAAYAYLLIAAGTVCLVMMFRRSKGIYRMQAGTLLAGALAPWAGNLLFILGVRPFTVVDPTPTAFALTGVVFYWGLYRWRLLDIVPVAHETVTRSMADAVTVLDTQQRVIDVNPSAERIAGRTRAELIGKRYSLPGQAGTIELSLDKWGEQGVIALGVGDALRYYRVNLSPIVVRQHVSGYVVILHDDTERERAEQALRDRMALEAELGERLRAQEAMQHRLEFEETIARISSRFVDVVDLDRAISDSLADVGTLTKASRAYLFVISKDAQTVDNTHEWCASGVTSQIGAMKGLTVADFPWWIAKLRAGEAIHVPDVATMPEEAGAERELLKALAVRSVLALPVFVKEQLSGFVGLDNAVEAVGWGDNDVAVLRVSADILGSGLERKAAADELDRLNQELRLLNSGLETKVEERTRQLEQAVAAADASNKAKSEFLASMSHELRTPLNAIIGFSQMLEERYFGDLTEKQSEYVSDILDSGRHLLALINDILDLSKIEAGKMELETSSVRISEIMRTSLVMVKEKAMAHSISLEVAEDDGTRDLVLVGDERRLKQVMFNLLSNATKFTPDGGHIRVQLRADTRRLYVSVSDDGIGLSPDEQSKLFQAFYQASGGLKDKTPGTGLGLAISRMIVEKHGGRIWVESEGRGKGSCFTFTLPLQPQHGGLTSASATGAAVGSPGAAREHGS